MTVFIYMTVKYIIYNYDCYILYINMTVKYNIYNYKCYIIYKTYISIIIYI